MISACFLHAHFLVGEEGRGAKGCEWGGERAANPVPVCRCCCLRAGRSLTRVMTGDLLVAFRKIWPLFKVVV